MLKYIPGLILLLAVLTELAYVSPTYAASANVMMIQVQARGVGAATQELVVLYNNSPDDIDVSDWCLKNKSNISFACFTHDPMTRVYLPSHRHATIATQGFVDTQGPMEFSIIYAPTNQSSGSIVGGSDTISLINKQGTVIDAHSWTTSLIGGTLFMRQLSPTSPMDYIDTDQVSDWYVTSSPFLAGDATELREADPDVCPNVEGYQSEVPEGMQVRSTGECRGYIYALRLSEILANASGSDTGKEFIEIYNPNDRDVDLAWYELRIGQNLEKSYTFPVGSSIAAHSYRAFTNADIPFSLLNTSSRVELRGDGESLDEAVPYLDPDEDVAWAVVDGLWQYTDALTPGIENLAFGQGVIATAEPVEKTSTLKPCEENQYRSPETNRCRNSATASVKTQVPCKDGQYRSEETNRCRTIASASEGPAPCKEGQERNLETNRCRTIKAVSNADYGVLGATTSNQKDQLYIWLAIGGIVLCALAYAVWEWWFEISRFFRRLVGFVRIRK